MATFNPNPFAAFAPGMFGAPPAAEAMPFDAMARQAWSQWGEWMRQAAAPAQPQQAPNPFEDALAWWTRAAQGMQPAPQAGDALHRWDQQARGWMAGMQQVATQFAGRDADAGEIATAWKQAMSGAFDPMRQPFGGIDMAQWMQQAAPWLGTWQQDARQWMQMPAFSFAREHTERMQRLAQAQVDFQGDSAAYVQLMGQALQDAFTRFEAKLRERSAPGRQLTSARALFDLWIDAAEEAYADVAISPAFREAYGSHVNAQMRLKAAVDGEVERATAALGMPTRTEVDAAHRKVVMLEREVRRLRDAVQALTPAASSTAPRDRPAPAGAASQASATPRDDAAVERADPIPGGKNRGLRDAPASNKKKGAG